jgi:hypothetical protein
MDDVFDAIASLLLVIIAIIAWACFGGLVLMLVWNTFIVGWVATTALSFWQATGIAVLIRLFFKIF